MRLLREFRFLFNRMPFQIIFYPTSRCNARCPHCYNYQRQLGASSAEELTLEEINKFSSNLGHIKVLTISGGEPFIRDDLAEIVVIFYKNNGLQYLSLHTNGFMEERIIRVVRDILRNSKDLKVIVCVSVDGIGELHDRIRGVRDGFRKVSSTVADLSEMRKSFPNLYLISTTMYSRSTVESIEQTLDFVKGVMKIKPSLSLIRGDVSMPDEKEVDISGYKDYLKRLAGVRDRSVSPFSPMALKEVLESMIGTAIMKNYTEKRQTVPCQAGRKLIVIYENGDVYPCETMKEKFGNLRESDYDLKRILASEHAGMIKNKIVRGACFCTWENIIPINLLFDIRSYPGIIHKWMRMFSRGEIKN